MRSDKYLWKICMEIYTKMYKEAEPSANFEDMMESGETQKENWFMKYYLVQERETEIIEEFLKKYKCSPHERKKVRHEIYLGSAPNSSKTSWRKACQQI